MNKKKKIIAATAVISLSALLITYIAIKPSDAAIVLAQHSGVETGLLEPEEVEIFLDSDTLPDFASIEDVKTRKYLFFEYVYRRTRLANERLMMIAVELAEMDADRISDDDAERIAELSEVYKISLEDEQYSTALIELKKRVRPIPPSLVLAQAANESAWGTSRFARQAYNLFGHWCYSPGCGLVPQQRPKGATHEVRVFDQPRHSVAAYIHNLNSSRAYRELRRIRDENPKAMGMHLAKGLRSYSEKGEAYVDEIQGLIKHNKLQVYDRKYFE